MKEREKPIEHNLLMKNIHQLGDKKVVKRISIVFAIVFFLVCNYFINIIASSLHHNYHGILSITNLFMIHLKYIGDSGVVRFLYVVALALDALSTAKLAYNLRTSFSDMNVGQKGASSFTTIDEIKEQYECIPLIGGDYEGLAGFPVAMIDNCFYIDTSSTNALIIGMTRSGKGEMFVRILIYIAARSKEKPSLIIPDLKFELSSSSYTELKNEGYLPLVFNIEDPSMGIQFNPVDLAVKFYLRGDKDDAELLCNSFAYSIYAKNSDNNNDSNNKFFLSNASHALSALIIAHTVDCDEADKRENAKAQILFLKAQQAYEKLQDEELKEQVRNEWTNNRPDKYTVKNLKKFKYIPSDVKYERTSENIKKVTVPSICHTFSDLAQDWVDSKTTKLDIFFNSRPDNDRAKYIYSSIGVAGGERTKGSIFSQALTELDLYMYQNITKLTSQSTIDLEDIGFGDKPIALFIGVPHYDRSKDPLVSTLIDQIFFANAKRAAIQKDRKTKRRIFFNIDEAGNYTIPDLTSKVSVGLGIGMLFFMFFQDFAQIDTSYGEKKATTIKGNMGNQVYIQSSDYNTAKAFSDAIGPETITTLNRMGKKLDLQKSFTEMQEEKMLISPNELMELLPGENVIKRYMKRTDLKGNKVKPKPIFNSEKNGTAFKYAYEYINDKYPMDKSIYDLGIELIDEASIPENFNYNISLNKAAYFKTKKKLESADEEDIAEMSPEDIKEYEKLKKYFRYDNIIKDIPNFTSFIENAEEKGLKIKETMMLSEFIDVVVMSDLTLDDKLKLINFKFIEDI